MNWIECGHEHLESIRAIFNEAIANSTALYEDDPRTAAFMEDWWAGKIKAGYPVLGAVNDEGVLMGFASYGAFRPHPGYKHTVEHSIYVDARFRGQGLGHQFLERIIAAAMAQGYHLMIGVIDADNAASIRLHERHGFTPCGHIREAGYKFGRWLDVVLYSLLLSPSDGSWGREKLGCGES
ncbi:phosphinothricin acetyltransferase [Prosthecobacter fusiformis]|uniref:Phosphinothricin acetyltransferase n=1 Tax=Prosthecobacter fusiformis TaxID=48464 RepID=A0A4R7SSR1_9BACT|nr:GNAT family N-acetyltransferase [Prosthecobacter fusiformis]TDU81257.1 phosphinothricin acetyltransferase [Prosthecobacter fusiformis]